jgi:beta-lactamase class A
VNSKENPYIFSIFTKNNADTSWESSNEAWVLTRKLSALLWKHFNPKSDWSAAACNEMIFASFIKMM